MEEKGIEIGSEEWRRSAKQFVDDLFEEASEDRPERSRDEAPGAGRVTSRPRVRAQVVGEEEGRAVRTAAPIYTPTDRERREHEAGGHNPYRSWCSCCVDARATAEGHFRADPEEPRDANVGEVHFDYCFLKSKPTDDAAVTLVGVDKSSDAVLAHVVPQKGSAWEWVAS